MSATDNKLPVESLPPPLIPLPSPADHNDTEDPFDALFSNPGPSKPLFAPTKRCLDHGDLPPTPSSMGSDFGAFVSVPPSMDPLYQGSGDDDLVSFSPVDEVTSSSVFFERFTVEAKERAGRNERRVLDELLQHEDDPMYWLNSHVSSQGDRSLTPNGMSDGLPQPLSSVQHTTSPRPFQHDNTTPRPLSASPTDSFMIRHSSEPPLSSSSTSTLSRKWMSDLLSDSVPAPARMTAYDPASSPPQFTSPLGDSVSSLTHSSHFATHAKPPSAPSSFTDDSLARRVSEFEVETEDRHHPVELTGRRNETTPVLTNEVADQLRPSLPALLRLARLWSLLYSLDQHGVSLQTLYTKCAPRTSGGTCGTLVVMRDSEDRIFGAWVGERLRMSPGAYYGSGESFLWTIAPHRGDELVQVFRWTGKNEYVALCESNFISFGGGEGKYGLYLDSNLMDGSSARCSTFDNEILCTSFGHDAGKTVPFECVGLEVWAVAS